MAWEPIDVSGKRGQELKDRELVKITVTGSGEEWIARVCFWVLHFVCKTMALWGIFLGGDGVVLMYMRPAIDSGVGFLRIYYITFMR